MGKIYIFLNIMRRHLRWCESILWIQKFPFLSLFKFRNICNGRPMFRFDFYGFGTENIVGKKSGKYLCVGKVFRPKRCNWKWTLKLILARKADNFNGCQLQASEQSFYLLLDLFFFGSNLCKLNILLLVLQKCPMVFILLQKLAGSAGNSNRFWVAFQFESTLNEKSFAECLLQFSV